MEHEHWLAYFAGIVDGEGSISTHIGSYGDVVLRLRIAMTDRQAVDAFADFFTLKVRRLFSPRAQQAGRKPLFLVMAVGGRAGEILKQLEPFMLVKKRLAAMGIMFADSISVRGKHMSSMQLERKLRLYQLMRAANARSKGTVCGNAGVV